MSISKEPYDGRRSDQLSPILIRLLQGFVFQSDRKLWDVLVVHQEAVRSYFAPIGLQLFLDLQDGFAFLRSVKQDEQHDASADTGNAADDSHLSLVRKLPLSFDLTLLCVLLREALEHFDAQMSDDHRLILKRVDIFEMMKTFLGAVTDETKQHKRIDALINKVVDMGFLKEIGVANDSFEVRRVIKAFIDAEKLGAIKRSMQQHLSSPGVEKALH